MILFDFVYKILTFTVTVPPIVGNSATYSGLILGTMCCLSCKFVSNYTLLKC